MSRAFNFSAGPAMLPEEVLHEARVELMEWGSEQASVMEISHRSQAFISCAEQAEADLRELLAVPDNYRVLFLQGGATQQFAQIPMNFATGGSADYVITGSWGEKAAREAGKVCNVNIAASSAEMRHTTIPARDHWQLDPGAAYVHITPNETIHGVEFHEVPEIGDVPLMADMSSTLLSRPLEVSRFGLIYAGAQKNIGPSGLVLVIVSEALLERCPDALPQILNYRAHAREGSMLNTPPTFAWYLAGKVFKWLQAQGGLAAMAERNRAKAELLYGYIDGADFYANPVIPAHRSWMNVPFMLADAALDEAFLKASKAAGLLALKGHRLLGGMRASIYNAMPFEGVQCLVEFMKEFARKNG